MKSKTILKNNDETFVFYPTQDVYEALRNAVDTKRKDTKGYKFISIHCLCQKDAEVPLTNGDTWKAIESGTIIRARRNK